jgi:hypothetical protein
LDLHTGWKKREYLHIVSRVVTHSNLQSLDAGFSKLAYIQIAHERQSGNRVTRQVQVPMSATSVPFFLRLWRIVLNSILLSKQRLLTFLRPSCQLKNIFPMESFFQAYEYGAMISSLAASLCVIAMIKFNLAIKHARRGKLTITGS